MYQYISCFIGDIPARYASNIISFPRFFKFAYAITKNRWNLYHRLRYPITYTFHCSSFFLGSRIMNVVYSFWLCFDSSIMKLYDLLRDRKSKTCPLRFPEDRFIHLICKISQTGYLIDVLV